MPPLNRGQRVLYTRKVSLHHSVSVGVESARVALLAEKAEIRYNPDKISPEIIAKEINGLGFHAEYLPDTSTGQNHSINFQVRLPLESSHSLL